MGNGEWMGVAIFGLGVLIGLIGWLLANKDAKQAEEIKKLFELHEVDSAKLETLQLDVAKNYNPKHEIASLFDGFKLYLNERFDRIEQAVGVDRRHP